MNTVPESSLYQAPDNALDALVANVTQLVSLPDVFIRFEQELNSPNASSETLADILIIDPDVTSRLLSLANSAFFGFSSRVETVQRALVLIGTSQVRDLILATAVVDRFSKLPIGILDMRSFWQHSIGTAALARSIATELRIRGADKLFVGGLLHDIGRLVLVLERPEDMADVLLRGQQEDRCISSIERETFGFDHADVGGALARSWSLPETVTDMIAQHHDPNQSKNLDVDLVHIADILAHTLEWGRSGQRLVPELCQDSWTRTRLSTDGIDEIVDYGHEMYAEMQSLILG